MSSPGSRPWTADSSIPYHPSCGASLRVSSILSLRFTASHPFLETPAVHARSSLVSHPSTHPSVTRIPASIYPSHRVQLLIVVPLQRLIQLLCFSLDAPVPFRSHIPSCIPPFSNVGAASRLPHAPFTHSRCNRACLIYLPKSFPSGIVLRAFCVKTPATPESIPRFRVLFVSSSCSYVVRPSPCHTCGAIYSLSYFLKPYSRIL